MIVEFSMTVELFMIVTKKILMSEKIKGVIILKQGRQFLTLLSSNYLYLFHQYLQDSIA